MSRDDLLQKIADIIDDKALPVDRELAFDAATAILELPEISAALVREHPSVAIGRLLSANDVIRRLCLLQEQVAEKFRHDHPSDCFCRMGGFWQSDKYGGTYEHGYRHDGFTLEFIENAVREALTTAEVAR